jgi:ATPase subunit of ABC transporter with duplicated ATPase domains
MASEDAAVQRKAMNRYDRLESEFLAAGGYAAEAEAAAICSNLALPDRLLNQPLKTLSGGQRPPRGARAHPVLGCRNHAP